MDRFPQNLVCSIGDSCPSWFVQMMTLGWPWPILWRGQIWYLRLFYRKKWKLLIFQSYCSLWPETYWDDEDKWVLKVKVISWPWPKIIYIWKLKLAFLRNHLANQSQILYVSFHELEKWKFIEHNGGHITKMAAMPIYDKNPSKIFPSGTGGTDFHENLVCRIDDSCPS